MKINNKWDLLLENEYRKDYYLSLKRFIDREYIEYTIYPKREDIFTAFRITSYDQVKVVILGQDPYSNNRSHGLAFSVQDGKPNPPSLKNIFTELQSDLQIKSPLFGDLTKWAQQGVLLLNVVLTVRANQTNSHKNKGWEQFTSQVLTLLNKKQSPIVFIFWGNDAKQYRKLITSKHHLIIEGSHPSPLSSFRGFFGGKYFSRTNKFLSDNKLEPIDWNIYDV